jgi:hypothetical protein
MEDWNVIRLFVCNMKFQVASRRVWSISVLAMFAQYMLVTKRVAMSTRPLQSKWWLSHVR